MAKNKKTIHQNAVIYEFSTMAKWTTWLANNHQQSEAIWIKFAKKGSKYSSLSYEEAREAAIIYGWIDGLINSWDGDWYLRRFTPRRPKSLWSKINRGIAEQLIEEGRMKPSGLVEVDAAKKDGRWQAAYSSSSTIQTPDDLLAQLKKNRKAEKFFSSLNKTDRYSFLFRLENAKKEETRIRWLDRIVEMLENGETFRSQVRKKK